jgi:hypothetical protein
MRKSDRWQIFAWLVLLFAFGVAVNAVRTQRLAIEELQQQAKVQACIAKSTPAGNATALAEEREAYERNPNAPIVLDFRTVAPKPD